MSMIWLLVMNGCFLQQAIVNLTAIELVEQLKWHVTKKSLQRSLDNQILDYQAILNLCENEIMSIKSFGICKESLISVENLDIEKWYQGRNTASVKRSSHHLVTLSFSRIGPTLTSEDESYVDIQSNSLCDLCIQLILVGWHG